MTTFVRLYIALIFGFLISSCFGCAGRSATGQPEITGPITFVRFGDPWVKWKNGSWIGVNDSIQYVIRRPKDSKRPELIFAVKQGFDGTLFGKEVYDFPVESPDYDYYSDDRFAVSLEGPSQIRKVSDHEWEGAKRVLHSYYFISRYLIRNPDFQITSEGVKYNERLYRKSGESWGNEVALVSPHKTRIAVFSYSSREKPSKSFIPGLNNSEPGSGEVFLDIYGLSSGEKVASVRSPYGQKPGGFEPSMLFSASVWIEDRYLIMPLHWDLSQCFVASLPQK